MDKLERLLAPHPRVRALRPGLPVFEGDCVLYWMQRAQRALDNPALNMAVALGNTLNKPVIAAFALTADYPGAQRRHYRFLVEGLADVASDLAERGVTFVLRLGVPEDQIPSIAREFRPSVMVGDENPLRVGVRWREAVAERLEVPFYLIDADVVVPSSHFPREEFAARTLRPKIHKLWDEYLKPVPNLTAKVAWTKDKPSGLVIDPEALMTALKVGGVGEVSGYKGGTREALARLDRFVETRLPRYHTDRNEPTPYMTSELSAHLHFGHINPLTIALKVLGSDAPRETVEAYLEELIVRRELSVNFIARNPRYDQLAGCPDWALKTLDEHRGDRRPVTYSPACLEAGETHDPLWNAAQREMVLTGRMHNYLRMYWAKKLLEWSPDPETAFAIAVDLNDRYEMDGRDPNGYTGIAWAIGGKHDRPWPSRPIFGTVRFMSYESTRKKFDSAAYIRTIEAMESGKEAPTGGEARLF